MHTSDPGKRIPVMRPALPTFDRLEPYLRRIDAARTYANYGPLAREFETRVADAFGVPGRLASASSGTAALVAAILATAGRATPERPFALLPAYTFVATALAVELCGYRPLVADIDAVDWMLSPQRTLACDERVGLIVVVAPYGRPFDRRPWEDVRAVTGIPIVIDAAAGFDTLSADSSRAQTAFGSIPVVLSFHATKSFSSGEGGAIVCTDLRVVRDAERALNLGFSGSRDCGSVALNGRFSEYHAAVGLAELDGWERKREAMNRVASAYRRAAAAAGIGEYVRTMPAVSGCYVLLETASAAESLDVARALHAASIDSRFWYGGGIHRHAHFANVERDDLSIGEDVAARVLGLPAAPDLSGEEIEAVVATIAGIAARTALRSVAS